MAQDGTLDYPGLEMMEISSLRFRKRLDYGRKEKEG
jgi:hypothetical protein